MATRVLTYSSLGVNDIHGNSAKRCPTMKRLAKCGLSSTASDRLATGVINTTFTAFDITNLSQVLEYLHGEAASTFKSVIGSILMIRRSDEKLRLFCFDPNAVSAMGVSNLTTYRSRDYFPLGVVVEDGVKTGVMKVLCFTDVYNELIIETADVQILMNVLKDHIGEHNVNQYGSINFGSAVLQSNTTSLMSTGINRKLAQPTTNTAYQSATDKAICLLNRGESALNTKGYIVGETHIKSPFTSNLGSGSGYGHIPPSYAAPHIHSGWYQGIEDSAYQNLMVPTCPSLFDVACYWARLDLIDYAMFELTKSNYFLWYWHSHNIFSGYKRVFISERHPYFNSLSYEPLSIMTRDVYNNANIAVSIGTAGTGHIHAFNLTNLNRGLETVSSTYVNMSTVGAIPFMYLNPKMFY